MKNNFEEPGLSLDKIKAVLEKTDACIYFLDPETKELIYMNEKMKADFRCEDTPDMLCWQAFQGPDGGPCESCPCDQLTSTDQSPIVRFAFNEYTKRYYKQVDSLIELDGRILMMHHSFDITSFKEEQESLKEQINTQELLKNISFDFASSVHYNKTMERTLEQLGEFLGTDSAAILKYDAPTNTYDVQYSWRSDGVKNTIQTVDIGDFEDRIIFPNRSDSEGKIVCKDIDELHTKLRECLVQFGIKSLIAVPLISEDGFYGILLTAQKKYERAWLQSEIHTVQAVCGIISAAIERRRLDQEYLKARQTLYDVIDNVPSAIYWKKPDLRYAGCNRLFANNLGLNTLQIVGKTDEELAELVHPDSITDVTLREIYERVGNDALDITVGTGEEKRWYTGRRIDILDKNGQMTSILGVFSDITDKVKADLEMIECDRQLGEALGIAEASDKAKTDFLSRMSHEIRTPMNAIIGMSHIAASTDDISKIKNCITKIDSASKHLLSIINDILDMSKIESGKMELAHESFNLERMLIETCDVIMVKADEKRQNIQFDIERNVPSKLCGDEFRLSQIITNLVSNAIKFTPEGGDIKIKVKNIAESNGSVKLEISVSDTGIGISQENQKKLFNAFEQLNGSSSRQYEGTGLGLSICKRIVELMKGDIWVESIEGVGSTFAFAVELDVVERKSEASIIFSSNFRDLRILFVDDSEETRLYFKSLMHEYNVKTDCSESGEQALELFESAKKRGEPYSIVFIDYHMPGINGVETARQIQNKYGENVIVILISVSEWASIEKEATRAGIQKFLSKPLFPSQIVNTINEILGVAPRTINHKKTQSVLNLQGKKILIAEDVEVNRDIIQALLEETKVEIAFAEDGKIALDMVCANPDEFDLVLMDVYMPVMDGYASTRAIRALPHERARAIPIVAMTANVFSEDIAECLKAGMDGHLGKPIDEHLLMQKLKQYLVDGKPEMEEKQLVAQPEPDGYEQYLPYIDVIDGLKRIHDNKKLFATMLKSYKNGTVYRDMVAAAEIGDIAKAKYCAHTLKGVAGNLSLSKIFEMIVPFETQLKTDILQKDVLIKLRYVVEETNRCIDQLLKSWE